MTGRQVAIGLLAVLGAVTIAACSNAYLFDERRDEQLPLDRSLAIEGDFCTPGSNAVLQPIKVAIAMDASLSMAVSDPLGTRAQAVVDLINSLPNDPEVFISVMLFAGSTTSYLTKDALGNDGFAQVTAMDDNAKLLLQAQILAYVNPSTQPDRDSTDFLKPLAEIYSLISTDISAEETSGADGGAVQARYTVIFMSDGHPSQCQDDQLICNGSPPVQRIADLADLSESLTFNTVHVLVPLQPISSICDLDGGSGQFNDDGCTIYCQNGSSPIQCPNLIINQDVDRLKRMAAAGNGVFRDFRNNEAVSFLNFDLGQIRRSFAVKEFVATNISAPPDSPDGGADSDGDGLSDALEAQLGTDPWRKDTDGDGFSDGVEVHFGAPFNPTQHALPDGGGLDPGCPPELRGVDTDCDTLLDCDEQLIGTNSKLADSDNDGMPDGVEWQMGSQPASPDMSEDPDTDGLVNEDEDRMHLNPLVADTANLSVNAYRYQLVADGGVNADGSQCFHFRVDNVSLAPTEADTRTDGGTGFKAGFNDIMVSLAVYPSDDPNARDIISTYRTQTARYPVGGIKSPSDGVIPVLPTDFIQGCPTTTPVVQ